MDGTDLLRLRDFTHSDESELFILIFFNPNLRTVEMLIC